MSNKQAQFRQQPPELDRFDKVDLKLTDMDTQLLDDTERRKAMLVNNVSMMFAEELNHIAGYIAKKKGIQFNDALFAGVFYDAPKKKCYILQFKSQEDADMARAAREQK